MLAVVGLVVVATLATWVAGWRRPTLAADEVYGVDVSNHQGTVDWGLVARDGVAAAYLKATEGSTFVDPFFARNWQEAQAAGVRAGAYHFFSLCSSGASQAAAFLRAAPPDARALPPALDLEILGGCDARPSPNAVRAELDVFAEQVEQAWRRPLVIYVRDSWASHYPLPTGERPRWRFSFWVRPTRSWAVWQVSNVSRVEGISGGVDLDVVRTSLAPAGP